MIMVKLSLCQGKEEKEEGEKKEKEKTLRNVA